ncbi:hypothetical protein Zmor_006268 [Zophobas morio]|uniref:Peptidase A2 domain-containing protein n=1 Tax=Zophobas morio TaxID=2755281 RepID=A0AA38IUK2_9CUCU|nr:hypothetical protein Zmor_006268 [Zophobas morio]
MLVNLQVKGTTTTWLIDSGASASLIKIRLTDELELPVVTSSTRLTDISGNILQNYGESQVIFELGPDTVQHNFVICGNELHFEADGLIGLDFLEKIKPRIDFENRKLSMGGAELPLLVHSKVPHSVAANHSSSLTDESGRSISKIEKLCNSPKEFNVKSKTCSSTLLNAAELRDLAGPDIREVSKNSSKHPNLIGVKEDLEIPAFHGCDYSVSVNTRVPAGAVVCEPFPYLNPGINVARSLAIVPPKSTENPVRTIVVRILNTTPTPLTISRQTPICTMTSVRVAETPTMSESVPGRESRGILCKVGGSHLQRHEREKLLKVVEAYPDIFTASRTLKATNLET